MTGRRSRGGLIRSARDSRAIDERWPGKACLMWSTCWPNGWNTACELETAGRALRGISGRYS